MEPHILVIDNDDGVRELLTLFLEKEGGWQVFSSFYANMNLAAVEQQLPDLIILDFNVMDGGKGWEFLQLLKMADTTANIPILITTTAFHLSAEVQDYLFTRYISVVHRPFYVKTFLTNVQSTLRLASEAGVIFTNERLLPILVVDDSEEFREAITEVLRLEGFRVVTAYNGHVALNTVSRADHCLILLDIAMPIMDGHEFLRAYALQLRPHAPVIILSGEANMLTQVPQPFVVEVLLKPFEVNHLLTLVKKYVQPVEGNFSASLTN